MNRKKKETVLSGTVTDVSRPRVDGEQVTFAIDGAVPLWAEVRVPNRHGWVIGDRVSISIVSAERNPVREAA
jgi:sRNA-binding carbon storage regulator CsrA